MGEGEGANGEGRGEADSLLSAEPHKGLNPDPESQVALFVQGPCRPVGEYLGQWGSDGQVCRGRGGIGSLLLAHEVSVDGCAPAKELCASWRSYNSKEGASPHDPRRPFLEELQLPTPSHESPFLSSLPAPA